MNKNKCYTLLTMMVVSIMFFAVALSAQTDNDNMRWRLAWKSEDADQAGTNEVDADIPVPWRGHNAEAWFDFDGDGFLEFIHDDNNYRRTYIYECTGDDTWEYRWCADLLKPDGSSAYEGDRGVTGTDLDGDGTDELLLIRTTMPKDDPYHVPPIRVYKHESGSSELLPYMDDWTVAWDDCPMSNEDGMLHMEYTNGAGDWDKDGKGEFGMNYKNDPLYYFAVIEVSGDLTPETVQFEVEYMIEKGEKTENNVARVEGVDLDNDGYDELYLPNRNVGTQDVFYLDCTGADSWVEYHWGPDDALVVPPDTIAYGHNYCFYDLDGDGTQEMINICRDNGVARNKEVWMWVTDINPTDPANFMTAADWHRVKLVADMVGVEERAISYGFVGGGDADKDGLADIYFNLDKEAGCVIMDAEFTGSDYTNPEHWNYYKIIEIAKDAGLADLTTQVLGSRGIVGDGDKDGNLDIWHNNKRGGGADLRPADYVWEYDVNHNPGTVGIDDSEITSPVSYDLAQNYPNPFNPTTTISYSLEKSTQIDLNVYDVLGRRVKTLVSGTLSQGQHSVQWDGTDEYGNVVASGVYFYSLTTKSYKSVRKMVLTR